MAELYDVSIIALRVGTTPAALKRLGESLPAAGRGKLLACWYSDIGALNQVMVIRAFAGEGEIVRDRDAVARGDNPFGVADLSVTLSMDAYAPFDFLPPMQPGKVGPVFEVRTYLVKPGGLAGTIEGWRKSLPARLKLSPVLTAMYTLGGGTPRFMHIWPYPTLEARQKIRADAVKAGVWPPPGGADRLLTQQSDIYFAAPFSPIQ